MSTVTLIIAGFIRKLSQQYSLSIPKDIIDIVLLFTPPILDFKGNTVALTYAEKAMIRSWFIEVLQLEENQCILTSKLLYDYEKNGKYGTVFYKHCLR